MFDLKSIFSLFLTVASLSVMAEKGDYGHRSGYLFDVDNEKHVIIEEMVVVEPPKSTEAPLKDLIFDKKITKEFKERYEREFGNTAVEQNIELQVHRALVGEYENGLLVTTQEEILRERQYGEYMVKRLGEHHLDKYMKTSPRTRKIYELKTKLSNVKLEVKKGYNFKVKYSYSGNFASFNMTNPYDIVNRVVLQMDPDGFGPSSIREVFYFVDYPFSKKLRGSVRFEQNTGDIHIIGQRSFRHGITGSITFSDMTLDNDTRVLLGFGWTH